MGYIWDYFFHKKGTMPKMRQEMSENLKILENIGEKVHLLGIDTCLSLNEIMDIRYINVPEASSWILSFRFFFPVSSTNKVKRHYIPEILFKMALNTITIALNIRQHDPTLQCIKAKTGWLGIRIICPRWGSYNVSTTDCCFSYG